MSAYFTQHLGLNIIEEQSLRGLGLQLLMVILFWLKPRPSLSVI